MKKIKLIIPLVLLLALILIGGSCTSAKSFYKKACKISVPFQEKLEDFYGMSGSDLGFYDDVDECIEESMEFEEELWEECMDEEDDEEECDEKVEEWRETVAEILTREGCEDMYASFQCSYYKPGSDVMKGATAEEKAYMEEQYEECMEEVEELCEDLPEKF